LIEVRDLKAGAGEVLMPGATIELHYQVARQLDHLDSAEVLQSSWSDGHALVVTVGTGTLRPEIEERLVGITVGTDRRLVVEAGTWPDVPHDVAISLNVVSLVSSAADGPEEVERLPLTAVPIWSLPVSAAAVERELASALQHALAARGGHGDDEIVRATFSPAARALLESLSTLGSVTFKHSFEYVGTNAAGHPEIDLTASDARTLVHHLEGVQ
jgi:hypothetical protein